jgi:DNA/RNA-binding domain of Phe-tRNA-synthetase-like protein
LKLSIAPALLEKIPGFKVGIITYENIVVGASPQMIKGRLQLYQESIAIDLETSPLTEFRVGITEWRRIFKQLGVDPSKYRPSHEALLRRIGKRQFLSTIHSAADINNFFSIQYGIPIGIYDTDQLSGDLQLRLGKENETYEGLNNRTIDASGKLVTVDQNGPFGSPYVDSKETAVTEETISAIQVVYLLPSMETEEATKLLEAMSTMFTQVNGGVARHSILQ